MFCKARLLHSKNDEVFHQTPHRYSQRRCEKTQQRRRRVAQVYRMTKGKKKKIRSVKTYSASQISENQDQF